MMTPLEVKTLILRIKTNMVEEKILIKAYQRYRDEENYNERVTKQRKIAAEAAETLALIQKEYDDAPDKIAKIERKMRYENKRLVFLNNYGMIEQLKKTVHKLAMISKEIDNGETDSDTQRQEQD